jgi:hypothetical protein
MAKKPVSLELALAGEPQADEGGATVIPFTPARPNQEKLTVYVPRSAAKRIKQMALDHDCRVNDFLQEGVELMLAKYGQPSLKDLGL